jgi:hypothetical protein
MIDTQLSKRISSNTALAEYETILTENGLMAKHDVSFSNHKIIKGAIIPKYIEQSINSIKVADVLLNSKTLEKNAISVDISNKSSLFKIPKLPKVVKNKKTVKKRTKRAKKPSTKKKKQALDILMSLY